MRSLLLLLVFSNSLLSFNYHLKPYKISKGIHCFFGLPSDINNINGGNMINSCYIETKEGYIVVDSGPTYSYAQEAYHIMEQKKKLPVKYVINTSAEEVHVLGSEFYKEQGAILFAPNSYEKYFSKTKILLLKKILTKDALINTRIIPINNIVKKDTNLTLGNMNVEIKIVENDDNNIYIYIKEKKILFAGDMIFNNRIVALTDKRSLLGWEKGLIKLEKLKWTNIISSHGYMTKRSALQKTKKYLKLLKNDILKYIQSGKTKKEILSYVKLPFFIKEKLYDNWHLKNVSTAYDELITKVKESKNNISIDIKKNNNIILPKPKPKLKKYTIEYKNFTTAIENARNKNKIVLIKVRSTRCKYCDQLDKIIINNMKVKKILNKYYEVVKINIDYENLPLNLKVRSTPTLIFIEPKNKKILMQLPGIRVLGELLEILNEAVVDGHNGGYLKE